MRPISTHRVNIRQEFPDDPPPPGMVEFDEFHGRVYLKARDALKSISDLLDEGGVDVGDLMGEHAYLQLIIPILPVAITCEVECNNETYYPADVAYDPRADVLLQLRRLKRALEADIIERPIDSRVVTAAGQLEESHATD